VYVRADRRRYPHPPVVSGNWAVSQPQSTPDERFAAIAAELRTASGVAGPSGGKGFGSSGLKIHDKLFAMLVRDRLVVKLPKARVDALVAAGHGERFDPRRNGRVMKEWLVVAPGSAVDWLALAREAIAFVATSG
jgi:hypothetical protein